MSETDWEEEIIIEGTRGGGISEISPPKSHTPRLGEKAGTPRFIFVVNPPNERARKWSVDRYFERRHSRRVIEKLSDRIEGFRITENPRDVPVGVINEGKEAVAAYLRVVGGWSPIVIADMMEVSEATVQQYMKNLSRNYR